MPLQGSREDHVVVGHRQDRLTLAFGRNRTPVPDIVGRGGHGSQSTIAVPLQKIRNASVVLLASVRQLSN